MLSKIQRHTALLCKRAISNDKYYQEERNYALEEAHDKHTWKHTE